MHFCFFCCFKICCIDWFCKYSVIMMQHNRFYSVSITEYCIVPANTFLWEKVQKTYLFLNSSSSCQEVKRISGDVFAYASWRILFDGYFLIFLFLLPRCNFCLSTDCEIPYCFQNIWINRNFLKRKFLLFDSIMPIPYCWEFSRI